MNVRNQAASKARAQSLGQGIDISRGTVGGKDELLSCIAQIVKDVEKLFLRTRLVLDELNVINANIDAINKETKKTFEAFLIFIFIPLAFLVIMAQGRYKKSKFCILLFTRNKKDKGKDYCQSYKDKKP